MLGVSVKVDVSPIHATVTEAQTRRATLKAVRAGIKIVQPAAKALAPKRLGHLRRAQGIKVAKGTKARSKTLSLALQGAKTKYERTVRGSKRNYVSARRVVPAFYDHLVLGGVRRHSIRKGSQLGRVQDTYKIRQRVTKGQGVGKPHPGHKANPYRQRAYATVKGLVDSTVLHVLQAEINRMFEANSKKLVTFK